MPSVMIKVKCGVRLIDPDVGNDGLPIEPKLFTKSNFTIYIIIVDFVVIFILVIFAIIL